MAVFLRRWRGRTGNWSVLSFRLGEEKEQQLARFLFSVTAVVGKYSELDGVF
ncbi:hypothetical protein [Mesobacillus zeae]|uniref:hypothetical protein n=1 Tax=Mesobacillus zeae TaxID=1917180 RepID=UPI0015E706DF|nr:hypothetical protein [Mesobacillus zeae]